MAQGPTTAFGCPSHTEVQFTLAVSLVWRMHDWACAGKLIFDHSNPEMTSEYLSRRSPVFCVLLYVQSQLWPVCPNCPAVSAIWLSSACFHATGMRFYFFLSSKQLTTIEDFFSTLFHKRHLFSEVCETCKHEAPFNMYFFEINIGFIVHDSPFVWRSSRELKPLLF